MILWRSGAAAASLALCAATWSAASDDPMGPPRSARVVDQSLGASYNRLGLQHTLGVRWSRPLSSSPSRLRSDSHLSLGATHSLTPSYTRLTAWAELMPLSVLGVRAGVEPAAYFGTFGSMMGFGSYDSPFGDDARRARKSDAHAGTTLRAFVAPTARLALGSFGLSSTATVEWWRSSADAPLFYEPGRDTLLKSDGDRLVNVSTALVRQTSRRPGRLSFGLLYDVTIVPDAPTRNRSRTLGVLVVKHLASRHLGLPSPTLAAHVGYYVANPSRKGQLTAAIGVSVERRAGS